MRFEVRIVPIMLTIIVLISLLVGGLSAEPPAAKPWEFDQSLYTNSPKTGQRVWQYKKGKAAYRDPNSWFDSPHMAYPFDGTFTIQPYDVFPYPYSPGPNAERPSYAPDPFTPEAEGE